MEEPEGIDDILPGMDRAPYPDDHPRHATTSPPVGQAEGHGPAEPRSATRGPPPGGPPRPGGPRPGGARPRPRPRPRIGRGAPLLLRRQDGRADGSANDLQALGILVGNLDLGEGDQGLVGGLGVVHRRLGVPFREPPRIREAGETRDRLCHVPDREAHAPRSGSEGGHDRVPVAGGWPAVRDLDGAGAVRGGQVRDLLDILRGERYALGAAIMQTSFRLAFVAGAAAGITVAFFGVACLSRHRRRHVRRFGAAGPVRDQGPACGGQARPGLGLVGDPELGGLGAPDQESQVTGRAVFARYTGHAHPVGNDADRPRDRAHDRHFYLGFGGVVGLDHQLVHEATQRHSGLHVHADLVAGLDFEPFRIPCSQRPGYGFMAWSIDQGLVSRSTSDWIDTRYRGYQAGKVSELEICGEMVADVCRPARAGVARGRRALCARVCPAARLRRDGRTGCGAARGRRGNMGRQLDQQVGGRRGRARPRHSGERILAAEVRVADGLITSELVDVPTDEGKAATLARVGLPAPMRPSATPSTTWRCSKSRAMPFR